MKGFAQMKKKHLSQAISVILSFFIMVCITVIAVSSCLAATVFRKDFFSGLMDDEYCQSVMESLTDTLKQKLSAPSNIPEEVFDNLFSFYFIKDDIKSNLNAKLVGIESGYNNERVREYVAEQIKSYAANNNMEISEDSLNPLVDYCMEEYDNHISFIFLDTYLSFRNVFDKAFTYILIGFSAIAIFLTLFLFSIHKYKHRAVRFCACSLFASSLMIVPLPLFLLMQGGYKNLNITPEHVKLLLVEVADQTLSGLLLTGLLAAAAGVAATLITKRMRERAKKGQHND